MKSWSLASVARMEAARRVDYEARNPPPGMRRTRFAIAPYPPIRAGVGAVERASFTAPDIWPGENRANKPGWQERLPCRKSRTG
jgi:hypothetical protein